MAFAVAEGKVDFQAADLILFVYPGYKGFEVRQFLSGFGIFNLFGFDSHYIYSVIIYKLKKHYSTYSLPTKAASPQTPLKA